MPRKLFEESSRETETAQVTTRSRRSIKPKPKDIFKPEAESDPQTVVAQPPVAAQPPVVAEPPVAEEKPSSDDEKEYEADPPFIGMPLDDAKIRRAVVAYLKWGDASPYGPIADWHTSGVEDMSYLFKDQTTFNADLSKWDVSNVGYFYEMFSGASSFNCDLSRWNTSEGLNFQEMFSGARSFTSDLSKWNTRNAVTFYCMFEGAVSFKSNLSKWNTFKIREDKSGLDLLGKCCQSYWPCFKDFLPNGKRCPKLTAKEELELAEAKAQAKAQKEIEKKNIRKSNLKESLEKAQFEEWKRETDEREAKAKQKSASTNAREERMKKRVAAEPGWITVAVLKSEKRAAPAKSSDGAKKKRRPYNAKITHHDDISDDDTVPYDDRSDDE